MAEKANIYEKLQDARVMLKEKDIKKTGENKHLNFNYYELGDFLPALNEIMQTKKLCSIIQFKTEEAQLRIVNSENPEEFIEFTSPNADVELRGGGHDIQKQGAIQTYQRRYLYMAAFEISEADTLDAAHGKEQEPTQQKTVTSEYITEKQAKRMFALANGNQDTVKLAMEKHGYTDCKSTEIKKTDYEAICTTIEELATEQIDEEEQMEISE